MLADPKIGYDLVLDVPRLIDEKRGAAHAEPERPLHAIHLDDEAVAVREESEGELVLVAEGPMALRALRADARDSDSGGIDFGMQVPDLASLARAARSEIGRVEVEDQRPVAQQIAERGRLSVRIRQGELGRPGADRQHEPLRVAWLRQHHSR